MTLKRLAIVLAALVIVVVLVAGAGVTWLLNADLRSWAESYASRTLARQVSIRSLKVGWGNPLSIEITDLKIANAPWASVPDMISIDSLSALLDPWSISSGTIKFQKVRVIKPVIVLERDKDGTGNWKFGASGPPLPKPHAPAPQDRAQFPTLLNFEMQDGVVSYKGLGPYRLRLELHQATVTTAGEGQPVSITGEGAYNGAPVKLVADTESFTAFHDSSRPFGVHILLSAVAANLDFKGTVVDPLDFNGVDGAMTADAKRLGDLLKVFEADITINPPLQIAGALKHSGDHWEVKNSTGKIATSAFTGDILFDEGPRGGADNLTAALRFNELAIDPIVAGTPKATAPPADYTAVSLRLDPNRGTAIDATVDAKVLTFGKSRIADFGIHAAMKANGASISRLNMAFAGGRIDVTGAATTVPGGTHVVQRGTITGADASQLARFVDALAGKLTGRVDGGFDMDMTGATLGQALRAGHGHAVLGMVQGSISKDLMEKLSTNLLNLFRSGEGKVRVDCLLGIVDMRNGVAAISPLRLRSQAGTLISAGQVDVLGKRLDLTIQSESATTGFFALDIPIRISGPFANPRIDPRFGAGKVALNSDPTRGLSPELLGFAQRNPCLH
jgi:uncharacterized protein involved in outer membrane biogenesis